MKTSFLFQPKSLFSFSARITSSMAMLSVAALSAFNACSSKSGDGTVACSEPLSACSNQCLDLRTNPSHCGVCGNACGASQFCSNGTCKIGCDTNLTACGSSCVDLTNDSKNCGTCGHACSTNQACNVGDCVLRIPAASIQTIPVDTILETSRFSQDLSARDSQGNFYIAGTFRESVKLGDQVLRSGPKYQDLYLAKISAAGKVMWAKSFGNDMFPEILRTLTIDNRGNAFIGGQFQGQVKLSDTVTLNSTKKDVQDLVNGFLAKYDADGNAQWALNFGSANSFYTELNSILAATIDTQGNVVASGLIEVPMGTGSQRVLLFTKINAQTHQSIWEKKWPISNTTGLEFFRTNLLLDTAGNPFVFQPFYGTITTSEGKKIESGPQEANALIKLSGNDGKFQWSTTVINATRLFPRLLNVSLQGQPIVGGFFQKTLSLGTDASGTEVKRTAIKGEDLFWSTWDSQTGKPIAIQSIGGIEPYVNLSQYELDAQGNAWLMGTFSGTFDLGNGIVLQPIAGENHFVAKLDVSGKVLWVERLVDPDFAIYPGKLFVDNQGVPWFLGYLSGTGTWGGNTLSQKGTFYDLLFFSLKP